MGRVKNNRTAQGTHGLDRAKIDHKIPIAEEGTPLGEHHLAATGRFNFAGAVPDISCGQELAFLNVNNAPCAACSLEQ